MSLFIPETQTSQGFLQAAFRLACWAHCRDQDSLEETMNHPKSRPESADAAAVWKHGAADCGVGVADRIVYRWPRWRTNSLHPLLFRALSGAGRRLLLSLPALA